ncbi:adenylylsulfate kinase [Methylohalomonas lacus]|uniref:Adenylyl-sulfate kinase n=1 Tax=Methylohalomonas lacus TaxID=398773 RepID=A0AAE3HLG3_9GAMM|nr:adenylyl-sulfate kinase [Methylohalomonas lacus]MCS3904515.1 adenylylsulfate kinase [Methylohalomonas lacus]
MTKDRITNQNTVWHDPTVLREHREALNGHRGAILWFTGLSGAGKSTIAHALEDRLHRDKIRTYVLDGDNVRRGLCKDLGFTDADRTENIRRIGEVSRLMMQAGVITLTAFISPFRSDRQIARSLVEPGDFIEIYCRAPLETCEARDPKGLYKKARAGQIPEFTGIDSPYEEPQTPEIIVDTDEQSVDECVETILKWLRQYKILT